jgi:hypothetical protein
MVIEKAARLMDILKSFAIAGSKGEIIKESAPVIKTIKNNPIIISVSRIEY